MSSVIKKPDVPLIIFFVLSLVFVLFLATPAILANYGIIELVIPFEPILIVGSWTPNIAAILVLLLVVKKRGAVLRLFKRWLMWRESPFWYLIAVSPLLVAALAAALYHFVDGTPPETTEPVSVVLLAALFFLALITGAMGEELGWRGFALPRLQTKTTAFWSSIIVGTIWGFWHLPLWFAGLGWEEMHFGLFVYNCVAISIIMTWVCNNTKGNLLLITMMHLFYNFGWNLMALLWLVPMGKTLVYQAILLTVYVIVVVLVYGTERLSKMDGVPVNHQTKEWLG